MPTRASRTKTYRVELALRLSSSASCFAGKKPSAASAATAHYPTHYLISRPDWRGHRQPLDLGMRWWAHQRLGTRDPMVKSRRSKITAGSARQYGLGIPNLPVAKTENLASCTASSATQCGSNPVSGGGLPKTGIFQVSAGD